MMSAKLDDMNIVRWDQTVNQKWVIPNGAGSVSGGAITYHVACRNPDVDLLQSDEMGTWMSATNGGVIHGPKNWILV
jgi:hypothetical protein